MPIGTLATEYRGLEDDELVAKLSEAKEELFNLRFQAATGQLENHGRLRAVRKDIARIYTVIRERELGITTVESDDVVSASTSEAADAGDES
jgi:large subunit ribosomal protein L29